MIIRASLKKLNTETVETDKIFRSRENISNYKANGIRMTGPALGRPKSSAEREKENASVRNAIEGKFGKGKRKYGLGHIRAKLDDTSGSVIEMIILQCIFGFLSAGFCNLILFQEALNIIHG